MSKLSKIEIETEIKTRHKIIKEGLERFLDENELSLTDQNMKHISNKVFYIFEDHKSISISIIHDYLQEAFEYQEFNISSLENSETKDAAEEDLMKILTTSDKRSRAFNGYYKIGLLFLLLIIIFVSAYIYNNSYNYSDPIPISLSQQIELKNLVGRIVKSETNQNFSKIWNEIKNLDDVKKYGYKSSYKSFNENQYRVAKKYLENRLSRF